MNDLKDTKSEISITINKATDIYVLKKEDLIKYCKSKKLNSAGRSSDLRSRLSRYIKGILSPDDVENTLSNEERIKIINKSIAEKIDLGTIEKEIGLPNLSPETSQINTELTNKLLHTTLDSLELFDNLNNSVNLYSNKAQDILNSTEINFSESDKKTYNLINLDTTNNLENTTVPFEGNKPEENNKKNILNQPSYTRNTPNMFNQGSGNKYMVIKPDSFSGQGDIKFFFKQYEKAAEVNNWDDKEKIKFLSIFLKDTANSFLENLENIREDWTWEDLKNEFLSEFQPIGYSILLKNKLENRRQENSESTTSYVTDIENLCRQVNKNMKEEDICIYILKGLKEPILNAISLHDNSNLKNIRNNLKKFELMQFRINSRDTNQNEYTKILSEQVLQLNKKTNDREFEEFKIELENRDREHKKEIKKLSDEIKQISLSGKIQNKSVNFVNDNFDEINNYSRYNGRGSSYEKEMNYQAPRRNYRDKSPYPEDYNRKNRESNMDRQYGRDRSLSRDREYYNRRQREPSPYRNNNRDYRNRSNSRDRDSSRNNYYRPKREYSRDNSHERTPERYRDNYEKESKKVTCYKCNEKGHYADRCTLSKND